MAAPVAPKPADSGAHAFNGSYTGDHLSRIAFPMGGIGAGMLCLEGTGGLTGVSIRHRPEILHTPMIFAAIALADGSGRARVLEGPVAMRKAYSAGHGLDAPLGLPRFSAARFEARFPFADVELGDDRFPIQCRITGWSPFVPNDADASSLPVAALEYELSNTSAESVEAAFSFHAKNFLRATKEGGNVRALRGGFAVGQAPSEKEPHQEGYLAVVSPDAGATSDCRWFRGSWFDALTMLWRAISEGKSRNQAPYEGDGAPSSGASLYVPVKLAPRSSGRVRVLLSWYVPRSNVRHGPEPKACCDDGACDPKVPETYRPWYATRFASIDEVVSFWSENVDTLRAHSQSFSKALFSTTLAPEIVEAVSANLSILKSPTVLRQHDGRLWAWEGCNDDLGCCHGTCEHVWNYAQALPHLFHKLERSQREVELDECSDERGHQNFRAPLPIRPVDHGFHAAADGQLGGIVKVYREWRISGSTDWLRRIWPALARSMNYCIETWDPRRTGALEEPQHNTYDIEFWGPNGMCTSFYAAALSAMVAMGKALGTPVDDYIGLVERARERMHTDLFNGEYFAQTTRYTDLRAGDPRRAATLGTNYSAEAVALLEHEGPKYQYGTGCLSDGVLGSWLALVSGLPDPLDPDKVQSHLDAVFRHNFKRDLAEHANPERPLYALGSEAGLLLCTWPRGGKLSLPFPYAEEVWTGIEYQVASHLALTGRIDESLAIVRAARSRYDGRYRNPFDEVECGHFYARALASYALLQAFGGARYDAVERVLYLSPRVPGDFRVFLSTATGFGTTGVRDGKPFLEVSFGRIDVERTEYTPARR